MKLLERKDGLPAIAWRDEGKGAPLVLVHGVGGESGNWDEVAARLAGFRIIRPDLRGHGRSGPIRGPIRIEDLARDVTDVMDALGVERARIAGFSLGGMVVQSVALDARERVEKLAILGAVCGRTPQEQDRARERVEFLRKQGLAAIAESNRERWFTDAFRQAHPDRVELRVQQLLACDAESYLQAFSVFCTTDHAARLGELRMPVLVATGEHDAAATARMARLMHERIAGSRLEILPGLRHSILIEAPDAVAALLRGFF
jgi:pimeloyl-ACP methyl ester carboxylesterase